MRDLRPLLAAGVLLLSGCATVSYKAVATFHDHNEVMVGTVDHDLLFGGGTFSMRGQVSGLDCSGTAVLTQVPPTGAFAGQGGELFAECSDGRIMTGEWLATSLKSGFGKGRDSLGNNFSITFGHSEQEAATLVEKKLPQSQLKPDLPTYNPEKVRAERGFSTGTGFVIADGGYILTNYHIVEGADKIIIHARDKRTFPAMVIAKDPANDIAIIKINESLPHIALANTGNMRKASEVMTIGYPLIAIQGQEQKATFGRINALFGAGDDVRFMQIDVPVQPGNSGGPLFNEKGEVVGIITATLDQVNALKESGALPQNVNYAIKSDYAFPLIKSAGINLPGGDVNGKRDFEGIIPQVEDSVVLVVTK